MCKILHCRLAYICVPCINYTILYVSYLKALALGWSDQQVNNICWNYAYRINVESMWIYAKKKKFG